MPILDNLIYRLKPQAGDTTAHNEIGAGEVISGGTITLVDTGANGYAWRFTGASSLLTGLPSKVVSPGSALGGVTMAIRLRRAAETGSGYANLLGWQASGGAAGMQVNAGYLGDNMLSGRATFGSQSAAGKIVGLSTTVTLVIKLVGSVSGGSTAATQVWWDTVSRVGTSPNGVGPTDSLSQQTISQIAVNPGASGDYYIHDWVCWGRELTDAECAAVADNITTALIAPDTTAPTLTGSVTISGITSSGATGTWLAGSDAVGITSYETSLDGTTWVDRGNVLTYAFTGLSSGTPYTARVRAKDAAGNVSTPAITGAFTTSAGPATATTLTPGSSGGAVLVASAPFTVAANGAITGTLTITPSDGGAGGTFIAAVGGGSTVTISAATPTATFTYTPSTVGTKTISISGGGLTAPASLSYVATLTSGTVTVSGITNGSGSVLASTTLPNVVVVNRATRALVLALTDQVTSAGGVLAISNGALVAGTAYMVFAYSADGTAAGAWPATAT